MTIETSLTQGASFPAFANHPGGIRALATNLHIALLELHMGLDDAGQLQLFVDLHLGLQVLVYLLLIDVI